MHNSEHFVKLGLQAFYISKGVLIQDLLTVLIKTPGFVPSLSKCEYYRVLALHAVGWYVSDLCPGLTN